MCVTTFERKMLGIIVPLTLFSALYGSTISRKSEIVEPFNSGNRGINDL
jgi:hypothetical protein